MRLEVEPHQSNRSPHDFPTIQTAMFMDSGEAVNHLYDQSKSHQLVGNVRFGAPEECSFEGVRASGGWSSPAARSPRWATLERLGPTRRMQSPV